LLLLLPAGRRRVVRVGSRRKDRGSGLCEDAQALDISARLVVRVVVGGLRHLGAVGRKIDD